MIPPTNTLSRATPTSSCSHPNPARLATPSLTRLPVETLEHIFSLCKPSDLRALVLCSHTLHSIVSRLLYLTVAPYSLFERQHLEFCDELDSNASFAQYTRRLDLSDIRIWPDNARLLQGLEAIILGQFTEVPQDGSINWIDTFFPRLRAVAGYRIPPSFVARHPAIETMNIGGCDLTPAAFEACGPGTALRYLECPATVAIHALTTSKTIKTRWVREDGVLAIKSSRGNERQAEAGMLLDALNEPTRGTGRKVPETVAICCELASAIADLDPKEHTVVNTNIKSLCLQVSYTKAPMHKFLPAILAHFPSISTVIIQHDPERPLSLFSPLHDVWRTRIAHRFPNVKKFVVPEGKQAVCVHGRTRCQPGCASFEMRTGFAVGLAGVQALA